MSKITYTKDGKVLERKGEFYTADSCYTTPKSLVASLRSHGDMHNDPMFAMLEGDVDELTNKPRRFFDHLLSIVEYKRDHDRDIKKGNHKEYWTHLIEGCELWLSAVNNGLYGEVLHYAQKEGGPEPYTYADLVNELLGDNCYEFESPAQARKELQKRGILRENTNAR